jgi:hypothetical protein
MAQYRLALLSINTHTYTDDPFYTHCHTNCSTYIYRYADAR